jgi:hypothetical protein
MKGKVREVRCGVLERGLETGEIGREEDAVGLLVV